MAFCKRRSSSRPWPRRADVHLGRNDVVYVLLSLMLLAACGCIDANDAFRGARAAHGVRIPEEDLNFGSIWASEAFCRELRLDNRSSEAVTVAELRTTCRCGSIEPKSITIPAGETGKLRLTLDLSRFRGEFDTRLIAMVRGRNSSSAAWVVRGHVRRAMTASSPDVLFNSELTRGRCCPAKSTKITALVPLTSLNVECDPAFAAATVRQETEGEYMVSVQPNEKLPAGPFEFCVLLVPELPSGERPPPTRITVAGTVWEEVEALPTPLNLAGGRIGDVLEGSVILRSRVMKPFQVDSVVPASEDTVVSLQNAGGECGVLKVRQKVSAPGHQQTHIKLVARSGGGAPFELDLPMIYYGLAVDH